MGRVLHLKNLAFIVCIMFAALNIHAQTVTVFGDDFTTSAGTTYTTTNGLIGSSSRWSMLRSGTDFGAGINNGRLVLSNDASGNTNYSGWVLAYTTTSGFASPYNAVLNSNPGTVTWRFNMRQTRSNPSGPASGYYANAFILAGTSNTTATSGSGYAVMLGNSGTTDPVRLVRYTAGLRSSTNLISSGTTGLSDFGNNYISVMVTFTPGTGVWQLYVRSDGYSAFQDPAAGALTLQGSVANTTTTGTSLPLIGGFWNAGTRSNQTSYFDNISVAVGVPSITSLSPTSKVANTGAFTLTVNGTNFTSSSVVRWNGVARTTTYVSPTQLTASIPATDITAAGTAAITVATGAAISNQQIFTIDPPATPSVTTSTNALQAMTTTTGTPSASQSFTVSGASLTADVTVTAPANFEVSANNTTWADAIVLPSSNNVLTGQPVTVYVRVKASAAANLYSSNVILTTTGAASKLVAVSATVLAAEPASSASAITFTNVTSTGFTINWSGIGTNHLVVVRQASAVTAIPADGTGYAASTVFGQGSDLGSASYVVYNATGTSVTVSGLTPATTYFVAIYEFNGSGGTQNYRVISPATNSRATINAPLGLQIYTANQVNKIDFDNTVDGVNNGTFDGGGVSAAATDGELSSRAWAFTGFSGGNLNFGSNSAEDTSYENGLSAGNETEGGLYAFEVAENNFALGIQPASNEFAPGTVTLRFQNQTGAPVTSLSIGYKFYVYNDAPGSNSFNFSHSANNSTYVAVPVLDHTTPAAADATPGWKAYYKVITLTGLNVASNAYYYIRWSGATVSGTVFDEIALDDVVIVANPSSNFASFDGVAETFTVAGNADMSGNVSVTDNILFLNNSRVSIGANTLTLSGSVTNTTTGGIRGGATSNLTVGGTTAKTLSFDQATAGTTNLLNNLAVNTSGTVTTTLGNALAVNGTLTVNELQTLNLGTNALTGTLATITNNGTVTTQNTTTAPFASGKTWGGIGTIIFNAATAAQSIVPGTYNHITISTTGGAVTTGNITVNGRLHLPNANPSATRGSLDAGSFTVFMGPQGTNTGVGDVSGITTRTGGIVPNVNYTFGHQHTSIIFPNVGTLPASLSLKLVLGVAPAGKSDGILRTYNFIQSGGSGTKAIIKSHYLDSELNGNIENKLVDWIVQINPFPAVIEQSRTNYNTTENFVELANVNVSAFSSNFGDMLLTMANSQVATAVWNGSVSDSWTTAANWTPNATPSDLTNVIIPNAATTPNDPILNPTVTIGTLSIEAGGILNAPTGSEFIITGANGAWINNGTFNAATGSNVTFNASATGLGDATIAGNTRFNNLTVPTGTTLRVLSGNYMNISGTFTKSGSFIVGGVDNTVEYSGTNQTIVTPNGANTAYHSLTISGTGAIVPSTLNINDKLITNAAVNFAGTTVIVRGNQLEEPVIGGSVSPIFNNLIINKAAGTTGDISLATNITVSGTLTLTSGILDIGNYNLTLGANPVAGTFSATTMIEADNNGVVRRPYTGTGSYLFPIGEGISNTTYSPVTVNVTSGSFNNAYIEVNVKDAKHPNNSSTGSYLTRYWDITQTGITNAVATITASYVTGDAVGGESTLAAAQLNGVFNLVTNPWVKSNPLAGNVLTFTGATLTPGQTSSFTGITASTLTAIIVGEGSFCQGDTAVLTAQVTAGDPPYTYEWSNGLGSAATAFPPTSVIGTTTYTLTVRDVNGIASTDTADVTVTLSPVAGVLSGGQVVCSGSVPNPVILTGYTGNIIRWERSINASFTNPTYINNTTATLTSAQIGPITAARYYRAVVQGGSCPVVYTDPVVMTVASTTWNGTAWSNGLPTAQTGVVFEGNFTASGNIDACSIQVTNGAAVVIPGGNTVTLNGAITVTSGTFTLQNNANLLQLTNVANSGNIFVERESSPLFRQDYTMWSSPVNGTKTLQQFSPVTLANRFYTYNTNTNQFNAISATGTFVPGAGYHIRMPNENPAITGYNTGVATMIFKGIFEGVPNNGNITRTLTDAGTGYNLVGNPYPSPLNIPAFLTANTNVIDGTVWIWRKTNNPNSTTSAYVTINSTGQYVGNGEPQQEDPNGVLRTGQGFIVRVKDNNASSTITFTNAMRSNDVSNQFFRMSNNNNNLPESHGIWLNVTNANGFFSQMYTGYIEGATQGEDQGIDAKYINDSHTVLASLIGNGEFIIQGRALPFTSTDVVPLLFKTGLAGTYTVSIDHVSGLFTGNQAVYLKDKLLNTVQDLKEGTYTFTTGTGIFPERFEIVFVNDSTLGTDTPVITPNEVVVYKQDETLNITSGGAIIEEVTIFDTRGRIIYTVNKVNSSILSISDLQAQEQVLIVNITTDKGKVSKKVIY